MNTYSRLFLEGLEAGYKKYLSVHPRSTEKIIPIHRAISRILYQAINQVNPRDISDFRIISKGIDDGKEYKFEGQYYAKEIDIAILYKGKPVSGLGFKFITSNYKQNANNYFENMLGETANLRRADFVYGQIMVLKHKMPYYSSDKKTFTKIEKINEKNLNKYVRLHEDNYRHLFHKPDLLFMSFVETGDEAEFEKIVRAYQQDHPIIINKKQFHESLLDKVNLRFVNIRELSNDDFSESTLNYLNSVSNFENFIQAFIHLTLAKTYGQ